MVNLTWEDIGEHIDKGDLKEWLKDERAKDKARQLSEDADTPQTDCAWMYDSRRDYEYDKALNEWERNE